jgi:hypothetical protein
MPHLNNIANIRINNVFANGNVNMGDALLEGTSANAEGVGGQSIIGDEFASPVTHDFILNFNNDPDIIDQPTKVV